jgi:MFS family permease
MSDAGRAKIPHRRWGIALLLGASVLINYFDRISLSVAGPILREELHINALQLGVLFSGFAWSYAILQIPSGMILDRFGVTRVGRIGIFLWGTAASIMALASGYGGIFLARMLLGIAEAPSFPLNSKATGHWFPRQERSLATALFDGTAKFSQVVGVPLIAGALVLMGWRGAFAMTAVLSFLFLIVFWVFYRDPSEDRHLSPVEYHYIVAGGAAPEGRMQGNPLAMLGYLLRQRKVWGLSLGFACYGYSNSLFQSWLPSYLVQTMHMKIMEASGFTTIPWLIATIAQLIVGGWLVDRLVARGWNETKVRKTALLISMASGITMVGLLFTTDLFWALVWITITVSGITTASTIGWSFPSLVAPRGGGGTVGSIMNTANAAISSLSPIVTGFIVTVTGSFAYGFGVAAVVLVIGLGFYVFVMGPIEPIPDPPAVRKRRAS